MDDTMVSRLKQLIPEPLLPIAKTALDGWRWCRGQVLAVGDFLGVLAVDRFYQQSYYDKRTDQQYRENVTVIVDTLMTKYEPDSVIDFGCAIGTYLQAFREHGIEVCGVEGSHYAIENAVVPADQMVHHDLRNPYRPSQQFDLAICFEVLEHIPGRFADTVIESISSASDLVVVSAAPPGQGTIKDHHHVNEQPPEYWIDKFETFGMEHIPTERDELSDALEEIISPIPRNLLVFRRPER